MNYVTLGRTGLRVSVAGLGCGGPSRLGMRDGKSEEECAGIIRSAFELGVNFLDTAEVYGTEPVIGRALATLPRDKIIISTKKKFPLDNPKDPEGETRRSLEQSLKLMRTDYIDVYHIHGVEPREYDYAKREVLPVVQKLREEGKIRFIAISEAFVDDMTHAMLARALPENHWDVVMAGFNILNQSARREVFPRTIAANVGTLVMFAVRKAFSQPKRLREVCAELRKKKLIDAADDEPLAFLLNDGAASSYVEAAYRFCRHEPGAHVILTGTGSAEHLKENIESINKPPLPEEVVKRLREIFKRVDCVTGN
ncbi:MAG TPA: aldo/keto reductase [Verrucomicrobiae bacterium]|jgi:aryl-alcohol dehydrogenase-like predicted oxidoreductase|nr:aldo/keto reductase [Verrucomicrobiae bacterium]